MNPKPALIAIFATLALVGCLSATFGLLHPPIPFYLQLSAAILALCTIGVNAAKSLGKRVLSMDLLATVAILAAIISGEYLPATLVAIMLLGGEMLEDYAQQRSSRAIQKLIEGQPQTATVLRNGQEVQIKPEDVKLGETVIVKPGAKIPVDGIIQKGHASIRSSFSNRRIGSCGKIRGDKCFQRNHSSARGNLCNGDGSRRKKHLRPNNHNG